MLEQDAAVDQDMSRNNNCMQSLSTGRGTGNREQRLDEYRTVRVVPDLMGYILVTTYELAVERSEIQQRNSMVSPISAS